MAITQPSVKHHLARAEVAVDTRLEARYTNFVKH